MKFSIQTIMFLFMVLLLQNLFAFTASDSADYDYEARPAIGLMVEHSIINDPSIHMTVMRQPFDVTMEYTPIVGIQGILPLNNWFGISIAVAGQQTTFDYKAKDPSAFNVGSFTSTLVAEDLEGTVTSTNLLVSIGGEFAIPVWTGYQSQTLIQAFTFGHGVGGKNFLDGTKFQNAELWGFNYGAGGRMAWGPLGVGAGLRFSYIYWDLKFDPAEATGEDPKDDRFILEYYTYANPYLFVTWALY
jgi:hypothetical protein